MRAQMYDLLTVDGEAGYFATPPPLPAEHPALEVLDPDQAAQALAPASPSVCRRGYVAGWKVQGGRLYLTELRGRYQLRAGPLLADWVTATLRLYQGCLVQYVDLPFASIYEQELLVEVEQGLVTAWQVDDNSMGRKEQSTCKRLA